MENWEDSEEPTFIKTRKKNKSQLKKKDWSRYQTRGPYKDPGERKGRESEDRVENYLKNVLQHYFQFTFHRTLTRGEFDNNGVDFLLLFGKEKFSVPLQVKSSIGYFYRHIEKYPDIPCIVWTSNFKVFHDTMIRRLDDYLKKKGRSLERYAYED